MTAAPCPDEQAIVIDAGNQRTYTVEEGVSPHNRVAVPIFHAAPVGFVCDGECDFHPIACDPNEGICMPGPLDTKHPVNCPDCLELLGGQR